MDKQSKQAGTTCPWCGAPSEAYRLCRPDCSFVNERLVRDPEGEAREQAREEASLRRYADRLRRVER